MRTISVTTEVFAEIWKKHKPGDTSEDEILRRLLRIPALPIAASDALPVNGRQSGYEDPRYGVSVPENFEIFRSYKGKEFRALAKGGKWLLLNDKTLYPSLHKLSWAVVSGHENSWYNWKYRTDNGTEQFIHSLRDITKVPTRG